MKWEALGKWCRRSSAGHKISKAVVGDRTVYTAWGSDGKPLHYGEYKDCKRACEESG